MHGQLLVNLAHIVADRVHPDTHRIGGGLVAVTVAQQLSFFVLGCGLLDAYPILQDVFYIQSQADPNTKLVKNNLIKGGKEWHQPDLMMLDAR
jgi:hypothetical protein